MERSEKKMGVFMRNIYKNWSFFIFKKVVTRTPFYNAIWKSTTFDFNHINSEGRGPRVPVLGPFFRTNTNRAQPVVIFGTKITHRPRDQKGVQHGQVFEGPLWDPKKPANVGPFFGARSSGASPHFFGNAGFNARRANVVLSMLLGCLKKQKFKNKKNKKVITCKQKKITTNKKFYFCLPCPNFISYA